MSAPPPSYNESLNQGQGYQQGGYGATQPPPMGAYPPQGQAPGYPPQGQGPYDPQKGGYPQQQGQMGYPSQGQGYPAQGQGYPPPQGYPQASQGSYNSSTVLVQPQQQVVVVGGCPACRVGFLEDDFTCCGVLCAILFFPLGILCCLAMRQRRCTHCAAVFG